MKIVSIEPTPSPYSMKINVDEHLTDGQTQNFTLADDKQDAPVYIQELFEIKGVKGIYRVINFIALERNPRVAWEEILPAVREVLGSVEKENDDVISTSASNEEAFGEVHVYIQTFRYIPMQVKLTEGDNEKRFGLPDRFMNAAMNASTASENMLEERKWIEQNPRYGDLEEIGQDVVEEVSASYDNQRLSDLVNYALTNDTSFVSSLNKKVTLEMLNNPNWKERYAALDQMNPTKEDLPVLDKALEDEKSSIRRLATAYLGMIEDKDVLPYLYKALTDKAVNVRRTAGDCLSDLGFKEAIPEIIHSLSDKSRLVRWRAAMFLYELGDETAISALRTAMEDPEFEVRMQVKMALARIEDGEEAKGSIWNQMTQATKKE
ncbi:MAG: conserved virulence factor C family protein [Bacillota bacterium]|uniref:Conserved virulence factor C family protein n=2 Tax=Virgibacillus TaxID=84406 RepID=A0A941DTS4_9BACI|nr:MULTISPECIES: conserved virulence factor C family protein [Bacillaceae]MCC2252504.1 conserved virulence factor C family protein [Virgibacillus sp. AGTR]NAZ09219.1 virulence factor [Agaribacter marinus]MBR7796510.1 conserved virulence factor C family protein [Virgibacillus salarius]MDY7043750.1 conserved virulence factor C family protein [Virgibacillus sp. M23]QRZ19414.1 conserved virulence factor C family protein [Virgibacillus sp. AGTR]